MRTIYIINGPNLNRQGQRQTEIYGTESFDEVLVALKNNYAGIDFIYRQSNCEGTIIDSIYDAEDDPDCIGIIINPGAFSHYSLAIADAFSAVSIPVIEVHISNVHGREEMRRVLVTGAAATGVIAGLGTSGYLAAADYLNALNDE